MRAEPNNAPASDLESIARARFTDPPLTEAELTLLRVAPLGKFAVCGPNDKSNDPENDPGKGHEWPGKRHIRAGLIRWLSVDRHAKELIDPQGIQIYGAQIPDAIDLSFVTLPFPLRLRNCRLMRKLNLFSAQTPALEFRGTWLSSIVADEAVVKSGIFLTDGFHSEGQVRLLGAHVGGDFACDGGVFNNQRAAAAKRAEPALIADGATVEGSVFLSDGFRAEGEVRLVDTQIGELLSCDGGLFNNPPQSGVEGTGTALNAAGAVIKGHVYLRNGFCANGDLGLIGAKLGGDLTFDRATLSGHLRAQRCTIKGGFFWRALNKPKLTTIDIRDASADALHDDIPSWPSPGNLQLDGFVYGRISEGPRDATNRLKWLGLQNTFMPQPYRQLAKVLKDSGDADGAADVLIEMERRQRAESWHRRPASWLLRWSVGYGYRPLWAFWELIGLAGLGWIIYRRAHIAGAMTPTDKDAYEYFKGKGNGTPPAHYPRFSPSVYSVENSLPLVKLGQANLWQPEPRQMLLTRERLPVRLKRIGHLCISLAFWRKTLRWFLRVPTSPAFAWWLLERATLSPIFLQRFLWCQIILGWILATLFAAGVTGIVHAE